MDPEISPKACYLMFIHMDVIALYEHYYRRFALDQNRTSGLPWIYNDNSGALKIPDVARHNHQSVNKRRGGNNRISLIAAIRNM